MVKIWCVGDPHGVLPKKIPKNIDLILCPGDLGKADLARQRFFENLERKRKGLKELDNDKKHMKAVYSEIHNTTINVAKTLSKITPTYSLQGNVGIMNKKTSEKDSEKFGIKLPCTKCQLDKVKNFYLTKNRLRILNGLRVGFLEHFIDLDAAKESKDKKRIKIAKKETKIVKRVLKRFNNLDILLCHAPPYGYLDKVSSEFGAPKRFWGKHVGSKLILDYIRKNQPRYVICGHIHEGKGYAKIGNSHVYNIGYEGDSRVLNVKLLG